MYDSGSCVEGENAIVLMMKRQSFSMHKSSFLAFLLHTAVSTSKCNAGWVDPDTPEEFLSAKAHFEEDTREYELVSFIVLYFCILSYTFLRICISESNVICL